MGIYYEECNVDSESGIDMDALIEAYLIDDLTHNFGEKAIQNFCAPGGTGEALLEAKVLSTNRIIKYPKYPIISILFINRFFFIIFILL